MTTPGETWTELRYTSRQVLPSADGVRDELDAVTWWDVDAVQCCPLAQEVVGSGVVAVFDLTRPQELAHAVAAYGERIAHAAGVLLTPEGTLQPRLEAAPDVERLVVFLGVDVSDGGADTGLPLRSADAVRARLAGSRALIASYPKPHTEDADDPAFLVGVPDTVRQAWADRGLQHVGSGVWTLPAL